MSALSRWWARIALALLDPPFTWESTSYGGTQSSPGAVVPPQSRRGEQARKP